MSASPARRTPLAGLASIVAIACAALVLTQVASLAAASPPPATPGGTPLAQISSMLRHPVPPGAAPSLARTRSRSATTVTPTPAPLPPGVNLFEITIILRHITIAPPVAAPATPAPAAAATPPAPPPPTTTTTTRPPAPSPTTTTTAAPPATSSIVPSGIGSVPPVGQATAWGCDAALSYLTAYAYPGFTFQCPGDAQGRQGMTCDNEPGICPDELLIAIADPCPAAYMNEASNSWVLMGASNAPIDPYGACG